MIICMPTSLLQEVGAALGAQAGEARLREVIGAGGFQSVRRATQTPLNMLVEARLGTRAFRRLMGGDRPTRGGVGNAPAESPRRLPGTLGGGTGSTPSPSSGESGPNQRIVGRSRPGTLSLRGTDGSNPSPSSGESGANLTRSIRAVEKASLPDSLAPRLVVARPKSCPLVKAGEPPRGCEQGYAPLSRAADTIGTRRQRHGHTSAASAAW